MRLFFLCVHILYNVVPQGTHEHMKELGSFLMEMSSKLKEKKKYMLLIPRFIYVPSFGSQPKG